MTDISDINLLDTVTSSIRELFFHVHSGGSVKPILVFPPDAWARTKEIASCQQGAMVEGKTNEAAWFEYGGVRFERRGPPSLSLRDY